MDKREEVEQFFPHILTYIEKVSGIVLPDTNYKVVKNFVASRLEKEKYSVPGYLEYLAVNREEFAEFINAVTINETYFFREEKHFHILDKVICPALGKEKEINFWSAACSSGEEVYSMAALGFLHFVNRSNLRFRVYGSDINPRVLETFEAGIYGDNSFRTDGRPYHELLFSLGVNKSKPWSPSKSLKVLVSINEENLAGAGLPGLPVQFQVIFLRNVLIYMDMESRQEILNNVIKRLLPGGYLFLSTSETALVTHPSLTLCEEDKVYFFQKILPSSGEEPLKEPSKTAPLEPSRSMSLRPMPPDIKKVNEIINFRIANPLYQGTDSLENRMARIVLDIIHFWNKADFQKVSKTLGKLEGWAGDNEIYYYLKGYLAVAEKRPEEALIYFRKAVIADYAFWLPRFHLGKLLKESSPAGARRELLACIKFIEKDIGEDNREYTYLLDGFNARYYLSVCRKLLEGLE